MLKSEFYLQLMGIPVWRLRKTCSAAYYRYAFYDDTQTQPIALLLADAKLNNDAEKQLVLAIVKAIKKKWVGDLMSEWLVGDLSSIRVIILLGERVSAAMATNLSVPVIISYSPAELLANQSLKVKAWEEIKKAMQMMETS